MDRTVSTGNFHSYPDCERTQRHPADVPIDDDVIKSFSEDYRVMPIMEWKIYDYIHKKHSSMASNDLLARRWKIYNAKSREDKVPFIFPSVNDFHFNNYVRFEPSSSTNQPNFRYQMRPGPGIDSRGHLPIPHDITLRPKQAGNSKKSAILKKKQTKSKS